MAQAKSVKDKLVGAWSLAAIYDETADGVQHETWGPGVEGLTIYTAGGQFSAQVTAAKRDKAASKDPRQPVGLSIAYFGTYSVDESAMTLAPHHALLFPGWGRRRPRIENRDGVGGGAEDHRRNRPSPRSRRYPSPPALQARRVRHIRDPGAPSVMQRVFQLLLRHLGSTLDSL